MRQKHNPLYVFARQKLSSLCKTLTESISQESRRKAHYASPLILFICLMLFCSTALCACNKAKTIILFNREPITKETLLKNSSQFSVDKRIYYIFISEKAFKSPYIRVRVFKKDEKANNEPVKMVYSNDFRPYKDQVYYYNDYIVIHEAGQYSMVIYDVYALDRPIAVGDFKVK